MRNTILIILPLVVLEACDNHDRQVEAAPSTTARGGPTSTAQPNSQVEVDHVAEIRRLLADDAQLSTAAKNVTIITSNGHVTLRGKVPTDLERSRVEELARESKSTRSVENALEIES